MQDLFTQKQTEQKMYLELLEQECKVNTDEIIEYPPVALSMGEKLIRAKESLGKNMEN